MENFEPSKKYQMRETETQFDFRIKNTGAVIESLKIRIDSEANRSVKTALEAQLRAKESELEKLGKDLRDFEERKNGTGHA